MKRSARVKEDGQDRLASKSITADFSGLGVLVVNRHGFPVSMPFPKTRLFLQRPAT